MPDTKLSDLTAADDADGTDEVYLIKGTAPRRASVTQLRAGTYQVGGTDVAVADGGTGASTASGARSNLGSGATGDAIFVAGTPVAAIAALMPTVSIGSNTTLTAASHAGRRLICTAAVTLTVNASTGFVTLGDYCVIEAHGGNVTIATSSATVNVPSGDTAVVLQHGSAVLQKQTAANPYGVAGALVPA